MRGKQRRGRINPIPGKQSGATPESPLRDLTGGIQCRPVLNQCRIHRRRLGMDPDHTTLMFGSRRHRPRQACQIGLDGPCAFGVQGRHNHQAMGSHTLQRLGQQGARLVALAWWKHHHERVTGVLHRVIHAEASALKHIGVRLEALLTAQPSRRMCAQR